MNDLISRQDAVKALVFAEETGDMKCEKLREALEVLNSVPPAQQWIPVSERLPDEDASVLASIKNHSFEVAVGEIDGEVFWIVDGFIPLDDVIAWMPLPEPYKE